MLCSWAPLDSALFKALQTMRSVNPDMIMIYIGEPNGCTADYQFENTAEYLFDSTILEINKLYQSLGWFT